MSENELTTVPASRVREWARKNDIEVGNRGHLSQDVVDKFNRRHRSVQYINLNPSVNR